MFFLDDVFFLFVLPGFSTTSDMRSDAEVVHLHECSSLGLEGGLGRLLFWFVSLEMRRSGEDLLEFCQVEIPEETHYSG